MQGPYKAPRVPTKSPRLKAFLQPKQKLAFPFAKYMYLRRVQPPLECTFIARPKVSLVLSCQHMYFSQGRVGPDRKPQIPLDPSNGLMHGLRHLRQETGPFPLGPVSGPTWGAFAGGRTFA